MRYKRFKISWESRVEEEDEGDHIIVDVLVIGAGPVGGYLCRELSSNSISVLQIEEHAEIGRPFQCAVLVTPSAMDKVSLHDTTLTDVWGARMHSPDGTSIQIGNPSIVREHVVCRKRFDEAVVRQGIAAGTELWLNSTIINSEVKGDHILCTIKKPDEIIEVKAKLLCGADGAHSWVRRHAKLGRPPETMIGFQAEVVGYPGLTGILDMYTGQDIAPGLFSWVIPNGDTHRIGLWVRTNDVDERSCEMLYDYLINDSLFSFRFNDITEVARYCGPVPAGVLKKISRERILLFGDAAAICKPTTGGGIGPGFEQVDLMLPELLKCIEKNDLSEKVLNKVSKKIDSIRKNHRRARQLRDLFLTEVDDSELNEIFRVFARPEVIEMINELGDIEKPVPLGMKLLKDVPEFRKMSLKAAWTMLMGN